MKFKPNKIIRILSIPFIGGICFTYFFFVGIAEFVIDSINYLTQR